MGEIERQGNCGEGRLLLLEIGKYKAMLQND